MKKVISGLVLAFVTLAASAQTDANLGIIPAPVSVVRQSGVFKLDKTVVLISNEAANAATADMLNAFIAGNGGFALRTAKSASNNERSILLSSEGADQLPEEGYLIDVNAKTIRVTGKGAGLFYGVQSLIQMMPEKTGQEIAVPASKIQDYPRFKYRGMHLDVGRHFFSVAFVKKYLDLMSSYKLNNFHWHLTEDQGWRIEIKKYPKLTSVGSVRAGTIIGHHPGVAADNIPYKGYYTQDEVKEVVAYAAKKFINVIPEIEMPGHASAAIAAYPQLSCFPDRDTYIDPKAPWSGSRKGKQLQQTWGVFDDVFAPTEYTFNFLQDVLDEVLVLFPSKYIHIGGDESPKEYWKQSPFCQQLIKEKGLKDEHELQSYFISRIEKYLNSKGRNIIGWDEILEGGLAPNATVMSWRGVEGGIAAAKLNHNVIMTPGSNGLYVDHAQSSSPDEPVNIGGNSPYSKAYAYDPVPAELSDDQKKFIEGVQANIWTEYVENEGKLEYQILPRMLALSEIAWSPLARKDYKNFSEERIPLHLARLDKAGRNYWVPTPLGQSDKQIDGDEITADLKAPVLGSKVYYTLDGTRPSDVSNAVTTPLKISVPKGKKLELKTIVITSTGKRSVVSTTVLNNGAK
ncbi:family 20 glycosylhydrolase [Pedobacter sp. MC2016-15]|jgi:hexosaminidase|uniref:beta-N-acetylhexosaminidase n=1 Tax=Pedobacter sp. MC2016-15 TaxID=2994473 RepID=UPI002245770C|nr:family 20 glycosylhydrolase [Pedobacter sp. MC2016-15]MCX2480397.1 family 20 glycosylhydrolase [Pedobacter sp. MC2016-15]